jgi:AcrR family transcriptional regulator
LTAAPSGKVVIVVEQLSQNGSRGLDSDGLLDAAAHLFREFGVSGTTVRAIADAAGMQLGSVTYRYPSKESLVLALMQRAVARVTAEVAEAMNGSENPVERLRLALRAHVKTLVSDDSVYVLLFDWRRLSEPTRFELSRQRHRYESIWDGLIYAAAASGQLATGLDLSLVRKFAFGAANSIAFWYQPDGQRDPEQIADAFSAFIGLGTLAPSERPADVSGAYQQLSALRVPSEMNCWPKKEEPDDN